MNNTIQFVVTIGVGSSGTPNTGEIPLVVPAGLAFRCRYVEYRIQSHTEADTTYSIGVSKGNRQPPRPNAAEVTRYNGYISFWGRANQITTSGTRGIPITFRQDVWELDYRLVMPPTVHRVFVGTGVVHTVVLAGEMVKATEGQRNAIIATQGGLH